MLLGLFTVCLELMLIVVVLCLFVSATSPCPPPFVLCVVTLLSLDHTNKGSAVKLHVVGVVLSLNSVFLHLCSWVYWLHLLGDISLAGSLLWVYSGGGESVLCAQLFCWCLFPCCMGHLCAKAPLCLFSLTNF